MSTENESLSNRSRSHRDEADTVLVSRGLKQIVGDCGRGSKHLSKLLIMGSTAIPDALAPEQAISEPGYVNCPESSSHQPKMLTHATKQ